MDRQYQDPRTEGKDSGSYQGNSLVSEPDNLQDRPVEHITDNPKAI